MLGLALDFAADGIAVIALVAVQQVRLERVVEEGIGGYAVGYLAAGQPERDRPAEAIGQRMDFCGPSVAWATDRLAVPPFRWP